MSRIIQNINRPSKEVIERFKKTAPSELGHEIEFGFISTELKSLGAKKSFAGPAVTVKIPSDDSTMVYKALSMTQPGDVLIIDMQGETKYACWGEIVTLTAKKYGVVAAVVDGPIVDSKEIIANDFPIYARCTSALTTRLYGRGGDINIPVQVGGVVVKPGDVVIGNDDGVVIIPLEDVDEVVKLAEAAEEKDAVRKQWFVTGADVLEKNGTNKLIEKMNISYE